MSGLAELTDSFPLLINVAGQATAGTPDEFTGAVVPFRGVITKVTFVPKATVTGVVTNNFALTVRNRGANGAGAVNVASITYGSGVNATAFTAADVTLNATAANLAVNKGDVLTVEKLVNGTGLAMPAGTVIVEIKPRGI